MTGPHPRRGPLSTIRGWMITIAVFGVGLGTLIVSPFVFIGALMVLMEAVAVVRFRESRRRRLLTSVAMLGWTFVFVVMIPIVSTVVGLVALYIYCSVNPHAYNGMNL